MSIMRSFHHVLLIAFVILLILFGVYWYQHKNSISSYIQNTAAPLSQISLIDQKKITLKMGSKDIVADVVSDEQARAKGLGGRPYLEDNTGMLFVFPVADYYTFWMKDMIFAIDIIWLNKDMRVVDIKERVEPSTYPNQSFKPRQKASYVLEVSSGDVSAANLKIGDTIQVQK